MARGRGARFHAASPLQGLGRRRLGADPTRISTEGGGYWQGEMVNAKGNPQVTLKVTRVRFIPTPGIQ